MPTMSEQPQKLSVLLAKLEKTATLEKHVESLQSVFDCLANQLACSMLSTKESNVSPQLYDSISVAYQNLIMLDTQISKDIDSLSICQTDLPNSMSILQKKISIRSTMKLKKIYPLQVAYQAMLAVIHKKDTKQAKRYGTIHRT